MITIEENTNQRYKPVTCIILVLEGDNHSDKREYHLTFFLLLSRLLALPPSDYSDYIFAPTKFRKTVI